MDNNQNTDLQTRLVFIFCLIMVVTAGFLTAKVIQKNHVSEIQDLQDQGRKLVSAFDHELKVQEVTLEIVGAEAHSILIRQKIPVNGTVGDLVPTSDPPGFTLNLPPGRTENQVGNLTGLGKIPLPSTSRGDEIGMALGLSLLFEQVKKDNATLPWIYYTSADHFIYLYPRVPPDEFFFSDDLLNEPFFTIATPEKNPERKMRWSGLYLDRAGTGLMIILSKPIYDDDRFLGVLSIDIGLSSLHWLLDSGTSKIANAYLIGQDGKMIVGPDDADLGLDLSNVKPETIVNNNGENIMVFPLKETPWYIVLDIDQKALTKSVINSSATAGMVFIFVLFSMILVLVITRNMRLARFMAVHDNLTGVLNRRAFDELSLPALKKKAPADMLFGVAVVDIDLFKKFNDTYGHPAGDDALRRVANALINSLRYSGDMVFRVGGEEFAVIMALKSAEDFPQILNRMLTNVSELGIPHSESPFGHVTVSIGGYLIPADLSGKLETFYHLADNALYCAKDAGRNRWMISPAG